MEENSWQRRRSRLYLFLVGLRRRMTLGARVMLIDGERIYLIRHTYVPGWHFPGGGIEPGESVAAGGAREVLEESGYRATGPLELFGLYHNVRATDRDHVALYLCRQFEVARAFKSNFEIAEFGWFPWRDLPVETTEATRLRVGEVFAGADKSELW